jgi:RNA polymerase sigma factor (sigma-70 family)
MAVTETASGIASESTWVPRRLLSDARLARLAARGDQRAFEAIFERYHQELYRYCRAILRDPDEAQDALQSTMASALRSLPGDERELVLRPWLYRVAHNEAISILRQRAGRVDSDLLPDTAVPGADAEAETRERLRSLVGDLDQLPERQRGALVMRELSGLSYAEIGAALAASEAAARQAVYEARVALRELNMGREMECDTARRAISERDGRVLRSRRLRAHLRACEACSGFGAAISQRRSDLRVLCPPLPMIAASGLLTGLVGGTGKGGVGAAAGAGAGGGTAGAVGGATVTGSVAVKAASIAAAVVVSAGAAGMSGVVKLPVVGGRGAEATSNNPAGHGAGHPGQAPGSGASRQGSAFDRGRAASSPAGRGPGHGRSGERGAAAVQDEVGGSTGSAGGAAGTLPATSNGTPPSHSSAGGQGHAQGGSGAKPASPPGLDNAASNAPTLPEQSQGKPGSPPGHDGTTPGRSAAAHSQATKAQGSSATHRAAAAPASPDSS